MASDSKSNNKPDVETTAPTTVVPQEQVDQLKETVNKLQTAVDTASTALMMVDRDFIVTWVNRATVEMLTKYEAAFGKVWPGFKPDSVMGSCIDRFHKHPEHQRRLLADPSRLPYRTDISVGDIKFSLCVNATYDKDGKYDGNILEWADVTELRGHAGQIAAINRAQAVIDNGQEAYCEWGEH